MNTKKSMLDVAVEIFNSSKTEVNFNDLWNQIVTELEMTEEEAAAKKPFFYTTLSMDGRFVVLNNEDWDLKSKHAYDEVHKDIDSIYDESYDVSDAEDQGEDADLGEEKSETKEFNEESGDESEENSSKDEDDGNRNESF